jgi:hypothetical protein
MRRNLKIVLGALGLIALGWFGRGWLEKSGVLTNANSKGQISASDKVHSSMTARNGGETSQRKSSVVISSPGDFYLAVRKLDSDGEFYALSTQTISELNAAELPLWVEYFSAIKPDHRMSHLVLEMLIQKWAVMKPAEATAWALQLPDSSKKVDYLCAILKSMAKETPGDALNFIDTLPADYRESLMGSVFAVWSKSDPQAALEYAATISNQADRRMAINQMGSAVDLSSQGAVDRLFALFPSEEDRARLLDVYVEQQSNYDPEACLAALQYFPELEQSRVLQYSSLIKKLLEVDAPLALKTLLAAGLNDQSPVIKNVLNDLAAINSPQVWEVFRSYPNAESLHGGANYIVKMANDDLSGAIRETMSLPEGTVKNQCLSELLDFWGKKDSASLYAWSQKAQGEARRMGMVNALTQTAKHDPAQAIAIFDSLLRGDQTEDFAIADRSAFFLTSALFSKDPKLATDWIAQLPDEKIQSDAIESLAQSWCGKDSVAASEWIAQLPTGSAKDRAAQTLIMAIKESDPSSALSWAGSLSDSGVRDEMGMRVLKDWFQKDQAAAAAALEKASLSTTAKDRLLKLVR